MDVIRPDIVLQVLLTRLLLDSNVIICFQATNLQINSSNRKTKYNTFKIYSIDYEGAGPSLGGKSNN